MTCYLNELAAEIQAEIDPALVPRGDTASLWRIYAVLVREYFGARIMGTVFGAVSAAASLGMALGPWAGGWVFDTFNGYGWLYVGSFGIGLAAVAIALTFPPPARKPALPSLDLGRAVA